MPVHSYDRRAAVRYAARWALSRNPAYADFTQMGGDCTNFVSQCLYAGAPQMNPTPHTGWYYHSLADRTPAWSGVRFLHRFLTRTSGPGPIGTEIPLSALLPGDVILLHNGQKFYHALLALTSDPDPLVAAHTDDSYLRPLSTYAALRAVPLRIDLP